MRKANVNMYRLSAICVAILASTCVANDDGALERARLAVLGFVERSGMTPEQVTRFKGGLDGDGSVLSRDDLKGLPQERDGAKQLAMLTTWLVARRDRPAELIWLYDTLDERRLSIPALYGPTALLEGAKSAETFPFFLHGLDDAIEQIHRNGGKIASVGADDTTVAKWLDCMMSVDSAKAMEALRVRIESRVCRPTLAFVLVSSAIRGAGKQASPLAVWYVGERCANPGNLALMLDEMKEMIGDQEYVLAASRARRRLKDCIDVIDGKSELVRHLRGSGGPTTRPGSK